MNIPTVGRIVHYTNLGDRDGRFPPDTIAALVTKVNDDGTIALTTFYPTGTFTLARVEYTDADAGSDGARGKWTWPKGGPERRAVPSRGVELVAIGAMFFDMGQPADGTEGWTPGSVCLRFETDVNSARAIADLLGRKLVLVLSDPGENG